MARFAKNAFFACGMSTKSVTMASPGTAAWPSVALTPAGAIDVGSTCRRRKPSVPRLAMLNAEADSAVRAAFMPEDLRDEMEDIAGTPAPQAARTAAAVAVRAISRCL